MKMHMRKTTVIKMRIIALMDTYTTNLLSLNVSLITGSSALQAAKLLKSKLKPLWMFTKSAWRETMVS